MVTSGDKEGHPSGETNDRNDEDLERIVEEYLRRKESEEGLDPDEFADQHPLLSERPGLREAFKDWLRADIRAARMADAFWGKLPRLLSGGGVAREGERVGDFRIVREIGRGGMGVVYEAERISFEQRVALKCILPEFSFSPLAAEVFRKEATATGRQSHPGIVTIHDLIEHDGAYYIVQELVDDGWTLSDMIRQARKEGKASRDYFRKTAAIFAQVADALQHAHDRGVIHCDLKPSNILLTGEGVPKVSDFGLACIATQGSVFGSRGKGGTTRYMSPEQVVNQELDARTDVFSLGLTLYEALTLEPRFTGTTSQMEQAIRTETPRNPRKANRSIPTELAAICMKALERDPRERYGSMADLARDLRKWLLRRKVRLIAAAALVNAAALIVLAVLYVTGLGNRLEALKSQFTNADDALGWETSDRSSTWDWCRLIDPQSGLGSTYDALGSIRSGDFPNACVLLEKCSGLFVGPAGESFEGDRRFLLGTLKMRLAADLAGDERRRLQEEGADHLELARASWKPSDDSLVWHAPPESGSRAACGWSGLRLNPKHPLCRLSRGLSKFNDLYKGGERIAFEEAKSLLESVADPLSPWRTSMTASICLARLEFFFGRSYDLPDLLEEAKKRLLAITMSPNTTEHHIGQTTLGGVLLLLGELDASESAFRKALLMRDGHPSHIQNTYRGLAAVCERRGDFGGAEKFWGLASECVREDIGVKIARAHIAFRADETGAALGPAEEACVQSFCSSRGVSLYDVPTDIAQAYLCNACLLADARKADEALANLGRMKDMAMVSPYEFCLASILTVACSGMASEWDGRDVSLLANSLLDKVRYETRDMNLPIYLSGMGALALLSGDYAAAERCSADALARRKDWGNERIPPRYAFGNAVDMHVQALARFFRGGQTIDEARQAVDVASAAAPDLSVEELLILKKVHEMAERMLAPAAQQDSRCGD